MSGITPPFVDLLPVKPKQHQHKARQLRHLPRLPAVAAPEYRTTQEMTDLDVPPFLQQSYVTGTPLPKITALREWQRQLLAERQWTSGGNAIVLVPTSGGKTLIADVAIAQALSKDPESKAIYALPFVSLASEKTTEYQKRFQNYQVRPFYQNIGGADFRRGAIAICTFEKVHSLLNCAIKDGYIEQFKVVVIDEIHMIGEKQRGPVLEAIIVKLLLLRPRHEVRIIGLTATLNARDAQRLAVWIHGFAFHSLSRPSQLRHYFVGADGELNLMKDSNRLRLKKLVSIPDDKRRLLNPIRTGLASQPSSTVLVFVNTRKQTSEVAQFIARYLYHEFPELPQIPAPSARLQAARDLLIQRLGRTETGLDEKLGRCVKQGVAFHHAGMLLEERKLIEEGARESTISVVVATTTLSAGVNIASVSRVIIRDVYRPEYDGRKTLIPTAVYTQMAGRAGRGERKDGDVFVFAQSGDEREIAEIIRP
jgi:replicative superfamily II helicase